jgi:hypothetical protein
MTGEQPEPEQPHGTVPMWPLWVTGVAVLAVSVAYAADRGPVGCVVLGDRDGLAGRRDLVAAGQGGATRRRVGQP